MCPIKHMHQLQPTHQLKPTPRIQNQPSEQSNELKNTHTHKRFQRSSLKEFFTPAEQNDPDGRGVRTFAKSAIYNAFWPDDSRFFIVCYLATSKHPRGVFIHCSPRFEKWSFPRWKSGPRVWAFESAQVLLCFGSILCENCMFNVWKESVGENRFWNVPRGFLYGIGKENTPESLFTR